MLRSVTQVPLSPPTSRRSTDHVATPSAASLLAKVRKIHHSEASHSEGSNRIERIENPQLSEVAVAAHTQTEKQLRDYLHLQQLEREKASREERRLQHEREMARQRRVEAEQDAERQRQRERECEARRQMMAQAIAEEELEQPEDMAAEELGGESVLDVTRSSTSSEPTGSRGQSRESSRPSTASSATESSSGDQRPISKAPTPDATAREAAAMNLMRKRFGRGGGGGVSVCDDNARGTILAAGTSNEHAPKVSLWAKVRKPEEMDNPFLAVLAPGGLPSSKPKTAAQKLWSEARGNAMKKNAANAFMQMGLMRKEYDVHGVIKVQDLKASFKAARAKGLVHAWLWIADQSSRRTRATVYEFLTQLQHEHTIVAAVAPAGADTAGDHLHDENVIHIFFTTMLGELCVLCFLRGGKEQPLLSLTTLINGMITTFACCSLAMVAKNVFRFGNRKRWPAPYRPWLIWRVVRQFWRLSLKGHRLIKEKGRKRREEADRRNQEDRRRRLAIPGERVKIAIDRNGKAKASTLSKKPTLKLTPKRRMPSAQAVIASGANAGSRHDAKWVPIGPRLIRFRFGVAWSFNILLYLISAWIALTFGVMFDEPAFAELLLAWLAGLGFTWLVIEPGEVAGLVCFPKLFNNDRVANCRNKCKELGIYG